MADIEYTQSGPRSDVQGGMSTLNWLGAVVSISLIAGLAVWGYRLAVRDVTGIPVVRALEGPMRVQPDDPGGRQASHQGLAVNRVQAEGTAEPAADTLILAPAPIDLIAADAPVVSQRPVISPTAQAVEQAVEETVLAAASAVETPAPTDENIEIAANQIAADVQPLTELTPEPEPTREGVIAASVPGVAISPRPLARPDIDFAARAAAAAETVSASAESAEATAPPGEVDPDSIAIGTRLVQLGAFDSAELARSEWTRLTGEFSEYFEDKQRVVQQASSGGRTFFRLRAMGFDDLNDARRFCSVLLVKDAACIPVEIR